MEIKTNDKYKNHSREELINELDTLKKKKYGLVWDKKNSQEMLDVFVNWENVPENFIPKQFPVLKEVKTKEIETDKNKPINLLIEGDNYHSLAVLNFTHQNKVDVIYIDPPYNTGNKDFIFNDTFLDKKGSKFVDKEDPWRHSKWLSFMEKRLRLAHHLLKNTGVIFISIDDNEQAQLRLLCDEIFEEGNFITTLIWKKKGTSTNVEGAHISELTEYVLCYGKSPKARLKPRIRAKETREYPYSDSEGKYRTAVVEKKNVGSYARASMLFKILDKSPRAGKRWQIGEEKARELEKKNRFIFEKGIIKLKTYDFEDRDTVSAQPNLLEDCGSTQLAQIVLDEIIGQKGMFDNPKPKELIQKLLTLASDKDSIILDFFAGSGTTGHAISELNKEDGGSRRFILCTNDDELDNNGGEIKHKICTDVCYPRVEKVIYGYKNSKGEKVDGLGGNLKYFKTDFVGSDSTDKNKRGLVNKAVEMICIKEDIFNLIVEKEFNFKIYQKDKKFLGIIFDIDAIADFKKEAEKHKGSFVVYCFSYTEATPEKEFKGLKNKYILKPIPAVILRIYLEIFKK